MHATAALQAVQLAMDRKDRERELVSALLPDLTPGIVSGACPPLEPPEGRISGRALLAGRPAGSQQPVARTPRPGGRRALPLPRGRRRRRSAPPRPRRATRPAQLSNERNTKRYKER